jgi:hypothetical protein
MLVRNKFSDSCAGTFRGRTLDPAWGTGIYDLEF